ncbi:LacI family transcriptional regulator [Ktedonosporobacter rubrisoli]|uniref:LacI family transcriptional regulator n=1 Tax=Ktedonosporobacter rubrisoli TaxID=2509675 RepID=A0A4V0YZ55_KTERU|nr:LacI family DNA-binding transcriptional regulator [Ktedonosporobacter rubrisoli]QBD78541.1 LacI family transcriptional regulator [Ktedonosporobacter rubrisoli]
MSGKHTIDDIARLAGVSKATVSRVLNHKPDVDPNTRQRILRIVEEQGFVPSITASGLAGGRSRLIGVLVPSFTWPFIPDVMRGIAEVIGQTQYELVLYSINDRLRENNRTSVIDRILATKLTAGLLAIFPGMTSPHLGRLFQHDFPTVVIDDQALPPDTPWVGANNITGAYTAVSHLIKLGHRRIAHIPGPLKLLCSRERYQGYCQALEEHGLPLDPDLLIEGDFQPKGGRLSANKLLNLPAEKRPTAIFAGNDQMAYGVLAAAEERGMRVPGDLALVGFDDISTSIHVRPALTTVRQPFYKMGQCAIEMLLSALDAPRYPIAGKPFTPFLPASLANHEDGLEIKNANGPEPIRVYLPTSLVVRASCGSPYPFTVPITATPPK